MQRHCSSGAWTVLRLRLQSITKQIGVKRCELRSCTFHTAPSYYGNFYNFFTFCKACHFEICFIVALTLQRLEKSDFISHSVIAEGCVNSILASCLPWFHSFYHSATSSLSFACDTTPRLAPLAPLTHLTLRGCREQHVQGRSAVMLVMSSISSTLSRLNEKKT